MRYRLHSLLLLVTVFGLTFGFYTDRVYRQKRAVAKLRAAGCNVVFDHEYKWKAYSVEPFAPEWVRRIVGDDWASRVVMVRLESNHSSFTDVEGQYLRDLPHLAFLELRRSRISDRTALQIAKLQRLKHLRLSETPITDDWLVHLSALPELEWLCLDGTRITDAGLAHLPRLKNLQFLYLDDCKGVTDRGLHHLEGMTQLTRLALPGSNPQWIWARRHVSDTVRDFAARHPQCQVYVGYKPLTNP